MGVVGRWFAASALVLGAAASCYSPDVREWDDPPDASSADATPTAVLRIVIEGRGKVDVELGPDTECNSSSDAGTICSYPVMSGRVIKLTAREHPQWDFTTWTYPGCTDAGACMATVRDGMNVVGASFSYDD